MNKNYYVMILVLYFVVNTTSYSMQKLSGCLLAVVGTGLCLTSLYSFYNQGNLLKRLNCKYPDVSINSNIETKVDITFGDNETNTQNQDDQNQSSKITTIPLSYHLNAYALMISGIGCIYLSHLSLKTN